MIVNSPRVFRIQFKNERPNLNVACNNPDYIGTECCGDYGFFSMYHGFKEDIRGFLQADLNMAEDDQAVYEFLQNAVDCHATYFQASYDETSFCVINNGEKFDKKGITSILNIGQSTKHDSSSIGRLGIGFKLAHRLVGKQNGLDEIIEEYKGPIIFSWSSFEQLKAFLTDTDISSSERWDDLLPHLFKIVITNFPSGVGERVLDLQHESRVVFPAEELEEMRQYVKASLSDAPESTDLHQGTIVYIRLGEGKKDRLDERSSDLIEGIQYSMNLFGSLSTISLNGNLVNKKELSIESSSIKKDTDLFKSIEPEYKDYDIQYSFGYAPISEFTDEGVGEILKLSKSPNFFKYFPMGKEVEGYGLFVHCDSFNIQSNRRELNGGITNEKLLPHIAAFVCETLERYKESDKAKYNQLYAAILLSSPKEGWVKNAFWAQLLAYIKNNIPIVGAENYCSTASNVKIKNTGLDIDLEAIGLGHIRWFLWNPAETYKSICEAARASNKLDLYPLDIARIISQADSSKLCTWLKKLPKDRYDQFVNELKDAKVTSGLEALPLLEFENGERLTFSEFYVHNGYVITNEHTEAIVSILKKLGYKCTVNKIEDHVLGEAISPQQQSDLILFEDIKKRDLTILTAEEKHLLFNTLKDFNNVGPEKLKAISLFKNINGVLCPLNKMVAYKATYDEWMYPYVIHSEEYKEALNEYLVSEDKTFSDIISQTYSDIIYGGLCVWDLYRENSKSWTEDMTKRLVGKYGVTEDIFKIVESRKTDGEIKALMDSLPSEIFKLLSTSTYEKESWIYRLVSLIVISTEDNQTSLRSKLSIDNISLNQYTLKNEISIKWEDDKYYSLLLSDILPNDTLSAAFSKVADQFSAIAGYRIIFSTDKVNYGKIRQDLVSYLDDGNKHISPAQYAFCMLYSYNNNAKGYFHPYVRDHIRMSDGDEVVSMFQFFYENKWGVLLSRYIYAYFPNSPVNDLKDKYLFSGEYTLAEERVPSYIEDWCGSDSDKIQFLKGLSLRFNDSDQIKRRIEFQANTLENWGSDLTSKPTAFLNWVKTLAPILGDKQKEILRCISSNYKVKDVNTRVYLADFSQAVEWDDPTYLKWKETPRETTCKSIMFIEGQMPIRVEIDGVPVATITNSLRPDFYFYSEKGILYVNDSFRKDSMKGLLSQVMNVYSKVLNQKDWDYLFTISRDDYEREVRENQELRNRLNALLEGGEDLTVEKHGNKTEKGKLSQEEKVRINREARMAAYEYLLDHDDYDCSEWDPSSSGNLVSCVRYKEEYIKIAVISSGGGTLHLHPRVFAELMENPNNLLLNYVDSRIVARSYKELFYENPNVNIIFDTDAVNNPSIIAEIANVLRGSKNSCFTIKNRDYSAFDEIQGFGLENKMDGEYRQYNLDNESMFDFD